MTAKFGFHQQVKSTSSQKSNTKSAINQSNSMLVRVTDVILDENHPYVKTSKSLGLIGMIICSPSDSKSSEIIYNALPVNSNKNIIPLINERVWLYKSEVPNGNGIQWFYGDPIALYGNSSVNNNASPGILSKPSTSQSDYNTTQLGSPIQSGISDNKLDLNSTNNPSQATFQEKSNIHPLMPFAGDIIYEGRFGQSIRLGNTAKSKSKYKNNWSEDGENGDPITILRNGQSKDLTSNAGIPLTENLNEDLSSLYLTSYQIVPISLSNESFKSYEKKPLSPSKYNLPQNILNSDRIIINAKSDSIILSAQKSVGLLSNESINIESTQIYMDATDIKMGSKEATEPALLGDKTNKLLTQVVTVLKNLSTALQSAQIYPGGSPAPDPVLGPLSISNTQVLEMVLNTLNNEKNGIRSNIVKLK